MDDNYSLGDLINDYFSKIYNSNVRIEGDAADQTLLRISNNGIENIINLGDNLYLFNFKRIERKLKGKIFHDNVWGKDYSIERLIKSGNRILVRAVFEDGTEEVEDLVSLLPNEIVKRN